MGIRAKNDVMVTAHSNLMSMDLLSIEYSEIVTYWLGGTENAARTLAEVLAVKTKDQFDPYSIVEERIRDHLKNDRAFFNEVVYGGTCDEDFDYILRCIHENEEQLDVEEWQEDYGAWKHLETVKQVADEYYGYDEIICLLPQWYCDVVTEILMDDYRDSIKKSKDSD